MSTILQSISIFPESRLWRIKKGPQVQHTCGGITTIILFIALLSILIVSMVGVFARETSIVTEQKRVGPPNYAANLTTNQHSVSNRPFMMAVTDAYGAYQVQASYVTPTSTTPIIMEPCTIDHFFSVRDAYNITDLTGIDTFKCLPLNQTYELSSGPFLEGKQIQINLVCMDPAKCQLQGFVNTRIITQQANPYNNTQFWQATSQDFVYGYAVKFRLQNYIMHQNNINIDHSVLPLQKQNTEQQGYDLSSFVNSLQIQQQTAIPSSFSFKFSLSQKYTNINVRYTTILDVLSYVGGLFNVFVAFLFFMTKYGQVKAELLFAELYFRSRVAKQFNFFSFIKQISYNFLIKFGCQPDWKRAQRRQKLISAVNQLLSVEYLQKRVQFLEKAITVLMDKHHIKGLHLLHRFKCSQVQQNHKDYDFRNRLLAYFKRKQQHLKQRNQIQKSNVQSIQLITNNKYSIDSSSNINKQQYNCQFAMKRYKMNESLEKIRKFEFDAQELQNATQKFPECENDQISENQLQEIKELDDRILSEEMEKELSNNLSRLLDEASDRSGDERSKRIVQKIDRKVLRWIIDNLKPKLSCQHRIS